MSEFSSEPSLWLTQTKLVPPRLRDDYLPRARLLSLLANSVTNHPLTLVSAPAGYGKTTLLADLPSACPQWPLVWLALGQEDNDFSYFCLGLITALQRLSPSLGQAARAMLTNPENQPAPAPAEQARRVMSLLINDSLATQTTPFVLVLDDLHVVTEPLIYTALDYLLERLPPAMRVVITTRQDPPLALARLRARGQLAELRLADLRFTPAEAAAFLNEGLHLALSTAELERLHARTEGWAAGLRLLAGSLARLNQPGDRTAFINRLAQTDRYLFDFLAEEVLRRQEPAMRAFLLETSILEELTPELCRAVTGRDDAAALLDELYRRNLFLAAVDDALSPVYRYHALFAEFLQQQLSRETPTRLPDLHRRAAQAVAIPHQRIGYYLAAQDWGEAAAVVEQVGEQVLDQGAIETLRGWLAALPTGLIESCPQLCYLSGLCAWRRWELDVALAFLQRALTGFESAGKLEKAGQTAVQLAYVVALSGDLPRANQVVEQALHYPIAGHHRIKLLISRAAHHLGMGQWPAVMADLESAVGLAEQKPTPPLLHALTENVIWGPFTVLPGGVALAERLARLIERQSGAADLPVQAAAQQLRALIACWRGDWAQAIAAADQALHISDQYGGRLAMMASIGSLPSICYALLGQNDEADRRFEEEQRALIQPGAENFGPTFLTVFYFWRGRVRWHHGRLEEARADYRALEATGGPLEWPYVPAMRAMLAALLALTDGDFRRAETLLREAIAIQERLRFTVMFSNAHILLAYLYWQQSQLDAALTQLAPVLAEYEQEDVPGLLMWEGGKVTAPLLQLAWQTGLHPEFAARALRLMGREPVAPATGPAPTPGLFIPETGQTLTPREIEILRHLATGASNPVIAAQLVLSPHTVKRHVANILTKLNVSTRTEATLRARDLGLL